MKRALVISLAVGLLAPISIGAAVTLGASQDTGCWDEYNNRGTRYYRTIAPKDLPLNDCTPAAGCYWGYRADGKRNRLYVPHGASPATACDPETTPASTTVPTTMPTTDPPSPGIPTRFELQPVGASLPSDAECAGQVRAMTENRPDNTVPNATRGTKANVDYPRVTGDFAGTTDEIIQWTACKWGIDEDWVRAQIVNESNWSQGAMGDFTTDADACAPGSPIGNYPAQWNGDRTHNGECPESIGLGQVRWLYHKTAFEANQAIASSAYNLDYTYAVWRECFEGRFSWLNGAEGRGDYAAGDAKGCLGVWFSGRWYTEKAVGYIDRFDSTLNDRVWEQDWFGPASPSDSIARVTADGVPATTVPATSVPARTVPSTTVPSTTVPATTVPATTVPATTVPATTVPATTVPATTVPATTVPATTVPARTVPATTVPARTVPATTVPATTVPATTVTGVQFSESFDNNKSSERFDFGVYHRNLDDLGWAGGSGGTWTGDHDLNCGSPDSQRTLRLDVNDSQAERIANSFYLCKNHMMSSMGHVDNYSVIWFSPKQVFDSANSVCFEVNLTDLGTRQWWKVAVVSSSAFEDGSFLVSDIRSSNLPTSLASSTVLAASWSGQGSAGYPGGKMKVGNTFTSAKSNPTPGDKATRHPVCFVDNGNGTVTFTVAGVPATVAGSFPAGPVRVVWYDHNYTPDKDGMPVGHTWHWDNIVVR